MNDDLSIEKLIELTEKSQQFLPLFQAHNAAAERIVERLHTALQLPNTKAKAQHYQNAIASFLAAFQTASLNGQSHITISLKNGAYSKYNNGYGRKIIRNTYDALLKHEVLTQRSLGKRIFEGDKQDDGRSAKSQGFLTVCQFDESLTADPDFWDANYIDTGVPLVEINQERTPQQRRLDKYYGRKTPKVPKTDLTEFERHLFDQEELRVQSLQNFWQHHPLSLTFKRRDVEYTRTTASATRIFHERDFYKGGRFYGAWTNERPSTRLKAMINNEPIAEIDIRASQPTLLSLFTGKMMKVSSAKDKNMESTWDDIYDLIGRSMHKNARSLYDAEHRRDKIKKCIMTMIGLGNPYPKKIPRLENDVKYTFSDKPFGKANNEFEYLCERSRYIVPALYSLGKTLNGQTLDTHFLSYHESEVILATIRGLHAEGIPAYPMHDCLIVPRSKAIRASTILRDTIMDYSNRLTSSNHYVLAPLTIERHGYETLTLRGSLIERALPPIYP